MERRAATRRSGDGRWLIANPARRRRARPLEEAGRHPLPPYIHATLDDPERYQTLYARDRLGRAAPTAGLHFTPAGRGPRRRRRRASQQLTLHVGLGTFKPLQQERLDDARLHDEASSCEAAAGSACVAAPCERPPRDRRRHHDAARAGAPRGGRPGRERTLRGETRLFITPGYEFSVVDALVTNFHLPRASLLALVMAFCGVEQTRTPTPRGRGRYRFYSFGDAMLVL